MQPGFRIAGVFGPGLLVVDDRSGFAAGIPRAQQLPIAPVRRELPLDIWFRIDGLPIKLVGHVLDQLVRRAGGVRRKPAEAEVWITRSPFASPDVGHAMPDQRARWNVEAAASVIFPAPGPPKAPGMPEISPVDRELQRAFTPACELACPCRRVLVSAGQRVDRLGYTRINHPGVQVLPSRAEQLRSVLRQRGHERDLIRRRSKNDICSHRAPNVRPRQPTHVPGRLRSRRPQDSWAALRAGGGPCNQINMVIRNAEVWCCKSCSCRITPIPCVVRAHA